MTSQADRDNLRRLTAQFDLLHRKLLRVVRALSSTEEQREALLNSLAANSHPAASASLERAAGQARSNRDLLQLLHKDMESLAAEPETAVLRARHGAADPQTLPESHARLLFAVLLFRDGILSTDELNNEVTAAFGVRLGTEIARIIAAATVASATTEPGI